MTTQISPMLAVSDGKAAIEFYKAAFGAKLLWSLEQENFLEKSVNDRVRQKKASQEDYRQRIETYPDALPKIY